MIPRNIAARMRHLRPRRVAVAAGNVLACSGLVGFIACSDDGVTAPVAPSAASRGPVGVSASARPSAAVAAADWWAPRPAVVVGDTTVNVFTIDPRQGGSPSFGTAGRIVIPAGAICDPATSGYGPPTWAKPCTPASANITFTVRSWFAKDGTPNAAFSPDVRFVPSTTVFLYLNSATTPPVGTIPTIRWCTSQMTQCVDESTTDRALVTDFDPFARSAWRRVKHLSGYNVGIGRTGGSTATNAP